MKFFIDFLNPLILMTEIINAIKSRALELSFIALAFPFGVLESLVTDELGTKELSKTTDQRSVEHKKCKAFLCPKNHFDFFGCCI